MDNVSQGRGAHHRHHRLSLFSHPPPPPDFCRHLPPLLIVKFPPLGSIYVSLNSNAFGTDVSGGIVLEIVIGIAVPIQDGLRRQRRQSAGVGLWCVIVVDVVLWKVRCNVDT
jgi:hypothetical protein